MRALVIGGTGPTGHFIVNGLRARGYQPEYGSRTSGPINAIQLDQEHGTLWGGSSNNGEDYGIAW